MRTRLRKITNFLAFNLLFFALYLNFIHQDKQLVVTAEQKTKQTSAAFSGTVLVQDQQKYVPHTPATAGKE